MELANWKNLNYVDLQESKITEKGVEALRAAKPGLKILAGPFAVSKVSQQVQGPQEAN